MNKSLVETIAYAEANFDALMELFKDLDEDAYGESSDEVKHVLYTSTLLKFVELAARIGYSSDDVVQHTRRYYEARTAVAYARSPEPGDEGLVEGEQSGE